MSRLTRNESRALGVLVEKAQTTPAQYPLTLNAIVSGCNQKSNRLPVVTFTEDDVIEALDGLRTKGLVREVMLSGSRVEKYRHVARDVLQVSTAELVVLAELLLRGPQTVGEIRGRASRMHPLESLDVATSLLEHLGSRDEPLVRDVPPAPGSRAGRYAQLLCPDLHPLDAPAAPAAPAAVASPPADPGLGARVETLERDVVALRAAIQRIETAVGASEGGVIR